MVPYKFFAAAILLASATFAQEGQSVYIMRMGSGFDQYMAAGLTAEKLMTVVTDPQKADFILTDRIGESFEAKLQELYPTPKPAPEKPEADKKDGEKKEERREAQVLPKMITNMGGGKGTIFLVDRKTKAVVWSTFIRPKNSSPQELNKTARKVVALMKPTGAKKS